MDYPRIDAYASLNSPIHSFDPRAKIITFSVLIFSFAFLENINAAAIAVAFSLLLLIVSRLPLGFVFSRIKVPLGFIVSILVIMAFTVGGKELFSIFGLRVSYEGVHLGTLIVLRATAALFLALLMLGTSRFEAILKALYMLRVPGILVQMLMFTYRYIFVFIDEFGNMKNAMESKGFQIKGNSRHALSILGNAVGMLLVKSYERGDRVYSSMVARGYTGNPIILTKFEMKGSDYVLSGVLLSAAVFFHIFPVIL